MVVFDKKTPKCFPSRTLLLYVVMKPSSECLNSEKPPLLEKYIACASDKKKNYKKDKTIYFAGN